MAQAENIFVVIYMTKHGQDYHFAYRDRKKAEAKFLELIDDDGGFDEPAESYDGEEGNWLNSGCRGRALQLITVTLE